MAPGATLSVAPASLNAAQLQIHFSEIYRCSGHRIFRFDHES